MRPTIYASELQRLIRRATMLLGEPALPLELDWQAEQAVRKIARRLHFTGVADEPAIPMIIAGRGGRQLVSGAAEYLVSIESEDEIRLVSFDVPGSGLSDFWAVGESNYRRFYRLVRTMIRQHLKAPVPYLSTDVQSRLWENSVGFLMRDNELLSRYEIPKKRGVLLSGKPGNGKTMACRWLQDQCNRHGIEWKSVSVEDFERARGCRCMRNLFSIEEPGVVLFDDFDQALTRRDRSHDQFNQATFLSELDGVQSKTGVVYLFTTNMLLADIDPAMRRPGRIDVILEFGKPDAAMRRRFIQDRWPAEALVVESLEEILSDTEGLSFAELEEARKLYVLQYLDEGDWSWPRAKSVLRKADEGTSPRPIGFKPNRDREGATVPQTAASAE